MNIFRLSDNLIFFFKPIVRLNRYRIASPLIGFVLAATCCISLFNGCDKNSPTTPSTEVTLQGDQAFRAGAVAGYQTVGAGVSYPFAAIALASPTGSIIRSKSVTHLFSSTHGLKALMRHTSKTGDTLEFSPILNLYACSKSAGNVMTMAFFRDSAGTQSAGTVTMTLPSNITNSSDPTSFASYPATIAIAINITGGNLPCTGSLTLKFINETGANTLTGTNTLTRDNVVFDLNLALDNQMNATGSIIVKESGATIQATSVQGMAFGPLTCAIAISPYGWTGTGVLNLVDGSMSVQVNTGNGVSTASSDSLGNLDINYADGTQEIVVNAMDGDLIKSTDIAAAVTATSGSLQSAAVNTAFASPLVAAVKDKSGNPVSGATVTFTAPTSGQSCTFSDGVTSITATTNAQGQAQVNITANATAGSYTVTASVSGIASSAAFSLTNTAGSIAGYNAPIFFSSSQGTIVTINNKGLLIGSIPSTTGSVNAVPAYWSTPSSQPQSLQIVAGDSSAVVKGLNDSNQIVGYSNGIYYVNPEFYTTSNALYWSSPTAKPQKLAVPKNAYNAYAMSINNSGQIVGYALSASNGIIPLYWPSPTDTPLVLAGSSTNAPSFITSNGLILGNYNPTKLMTTVVWSSPPAQPVALKDLTSSGIIYPIYPSSINASGVIVGLCSDSGSLIPVMWTNADSSPQALPLPSSLLQLGMFNAASINTAGIIVGSVPNGYGGGDCTIWKNGQVQDLAVLTNNFAVGEALLITDKGWILGVAYFGHNQYILIPK